MIMDKEEIREVLEMLRTAGVRPMLCTQCVPVSTQAAKCGPLTEVFDQEIEDYMQLPKALVGLQPEMMIPVSGDSMIDAGYEEGDLLQVRMNAPYRDLDNVLAMVDGLCTVKTLYTDEQGQTWLVPRNEKYRAILLNEEQDVRILGVVVGLQKRTPRASAREVIMAVRRTKNEMHAMRKLTEQEVDSCLMAIGESVKHARQWYAVLRVLRDNGLAGEDDYGMFCERVARLMPDHGHLPVAKELSRMAVYSFAKCVYLWDEANAPVTGARYRDYRNIALNMQQLLANVRDPKTPTKNSKNPS